MRRPPCSTLPTSSCAARYLENPDVRVALFVGGIDEKEQFRALEEGVDICVGTLQKARAGGLPVHFSPADRVSILLCSNSPRKDHRLFTQEA